MGNNTTLIRSFAIQRRVLYALMMREVITRFGRNNLGALWLIGEPMIFTLGIVALWTASGMNHGSMAGSGPEGGHAARGKAGWELYVRHP